MKEVIYSGRFKMNFAAISQNRISFQLFDLTVIMKMDILEPRGIDICRESRFAPSNSSIV